MGHKTPPAFLKRCDLCGFRGDVEEFVVVGNDEDNVLDFLHWAENVATSAWVCESCQALVNAFRARTRRLLLMHCSLIGVSRANPLQHEDEDHLANLREGWRADAP
jgi:hypothetical protein